jgi:Mn2+/Fe2+ NRAMP family transporter
MAKHKKFRYADGVKRESRRKTSMRIITFIIALVVIAGLVVIFPFDIAAETLTDGSEQAVQAMDSLSAAESAVEIAVTEDGAGMFTLANALLIGCGFLAGFVLGEVFRYVYRKREKNAADEKST